MDIAPNIHQLKSIVSNQYLIIDGDQLVLIDTGLLNNDRKILKYINRLGYHPTDLKSIFITHADGDHAGAIGKLKAATGAQVFASQLEADAIRAGNPSRPLKPRGIQRPVYALTKLMMPAVKNPVDVIVNNGEILPIMDGLEIIHTPGHTPGHTSFYIRQKQILFAGDSIWLASNRLKAMMSEANTWDSALAVQSFDMQMSLNPKIIAAGHFLFKSG